MENKVKLTNPLDDYQLLQDKDETYFFANFDGSGVETTTVLENTASPYVTNEETGEPGVVTGEPLNAVPRGDLDKNTYDNTSDVYYNPEYTYEVETEEDNEPSSGDTNNNGGDETSGDTNNG